MIWHSLRLHGEGFAESALNLCDHVGYTSVPRLSLSRLRKIIQKFACIVPAVSQHPQTPVHILGDLNHAVLFEQRRDLGIVI